MTAENPKELRKADEYPLVNSTVTAWEDGELQRFYETRYEDAPPMCTVDPPSGAEVEEYEQRMNKNL